MNKRAAAQTIAPCYGIVILTLITQLSEQQMLSKPEQAPTRVPARFQDDKQRRGQRGVSYLIASCAHSANWMSADVPQPSELAQLQHDLESEPHELHTWPAQQDAIYSHAECSKHIELPSETFLEHPPEASGWLAATPEHQQSLVYVPMVPVTPSPEINTGLELMQGATAAVRRCSAAAT